MPKLQVGHFYFLNNQYFVDFPDSLLMHNKERIDGHSHDRPFFCALEEQDTGVFWMIPISSRLSKFQSIYNKLIARYKRCDIIGFADVLGYKKAFLLQNMCPATDFYVKNEYTNADVPVKIRDDSQSFFTAKAKYVLALQAMGKKVIFPDVISIKKKLVP